LLWSFVFAGSVAIMWGANLSIVFPVVTVLMEDGNVSDYVKKQIADAQKEIAFYESEVSRLQNELREATEFGNDSAIFDAQRALTRSRGKITVWSSRLVGLQRVEVYLLPYLPNDKFDLLTVIFGALVMLTIVKLACMFFEETLLGQVVQLTMMQLRKHCFRKVLSLDYQSICSEGTQGLMSRFTYDMETLANGLSLLGGKLVREPLKAIVCLSLAFWMNWRLMLLSVVFVPLAVLVFHRLGRMLKKASHRGMESMNRIYKVLGEAFDASKIVIAFGGQRRHLAHHHRESKTYYQKSMRIVYADALTSPATEVLGLIAVLVSVLPGAYLVLRGEESIWQIRLSSGRMDIAELSVLYAFLAGAIDPARKMTSVFSKLKKAGAAAERIFELLDRKPLVEETARPVPFPRRIDDIEYRSVGFTYARGRGRPAALDDVNVRIAAGEIVAVVGENGSGKSTLVNLLPRFFDPDAGRVLINGVDIRDFRLADLRARIGVVTQETLLFDDTLYNNIQYGKPSAGIDEVTAAAAAGHVMSFVQQLPDGLQTLVGERGSALSGGQRQRVALARAMLRDPAILILDEATSAIDAQSETLIHESLQSFARGRTVFIITHDITPGIRGLMTRVLVMDKGKVVAFGRHDDLLASCERYRTLYRSQTARHGGNGPANEPDVEPPDEPDGGDRPSLLPFRNDGRHRA
jgi:subfamily B ATP-binding cassette protein MsbA